LFFINISCLGMEKTKPSIPQRPQFARDVPDPAGAPATDTLQTGIAGVREQSW